MVLASLYLPESPGAQRQELPLRVRCKNGQFEVMDRSGGQDTFNSDCLEAWQMAAMAGQVWYWRKNDGMDRYGFEVQTMDGDIPVDVNGWLAGNSFLIPAMDYLTTFKFGERRYKAPVSAADYIQQRYRAEFRVLGKTLASSADEARRAMATRPTWMKEGDVESLRISADMMDEDGTGTIGRMTYKMADRSAVDVKNGDTIVAPVFVHNGERVVFSDYSRV